MPKVIRLPITNADMLPCLNQAEIDEGWKVGWKNGPYPDESKSFSFWHGWMNGHAQAGYRPPTPQQIALAKDYERKQHKFANYGRQRQ